MRMQVRKNIFDGMSTRYLRDFTRDKVYAGVIFLL